MDLLSLLTCTTFGASGQCLVPIANESFCAVSLSTLQSQLRVAIYLESLRPTYERRGRLLLFDTFTRGANSRPGSYCQLP